MERREFVKSLTIGAVVLAFPKLAKRRGPLPVLYCDGTHDDAPAVQALMNDEDAWDATTGTVLRGDCWEIVNRQMRWSRTILMPIEGKEEDRNEYHRFETINEPPKVIRGEIRGCTIACHEIVDGPALLGYYAGDADGIARAWASYRHSVLEGTMA